MPDKGFIVHSFIHQTKPIIYLVGRLVTGETFVVLENREVPCFYIRQGEYAPARQTAHIEECGFHTQDGALLMRITAGSNRELQQTRQSLESRGMRTYEADVPFAEQYFIARKIHGTVAIEGRYTKGKWVDRIYLNPEVAASEYFPEPVLLALDIETTVSAPAQEIRAIGLAGENRWKKRHLHTVLLTGAETGKEFIRSFPDEKSLLKVFCELLSGFDPDIITGWNVIDFDFAVIAARLKAHGLPLNFGRSSRPAAFLPAGRQSKARLIIPGRQVIDSMWLLRASPDRYADYSLETVSRQLLGEGKEVAAQGEDKLAVLEALYKNDPQAFASYCLQDAELVLKILKKTGLMDLTVRRCLLTGVALEKAWTSIGPFEHLYMEALHSRGIIAPTLGVDAPPAYGAAGGLVFAPESDLFGNVFVFDFKSLYPSLIRTFNIDPASFIPHAPAGDHIKAPNGACFSRAPGILPGIVDEFFKKREQAKRDGDALASYVYKILMNSFYGVLGTKGCRFASSLFAGAITGFGQYILVWCKKLLTDKNFRVLYGDTDSLFVQSSLVRDASYADLYRQGREIRSLVNGELARFIAAEYRLTSQLDLEFEKIYRWLFIPPIRALRETDGNTVRQGRTKGYAGFILSATAPAHPEMLVEIKGMEAVRSDWTPLAHAFQIRLLTLLFTGVPHAEIAAYIRQTVAELSAGKLDAKLIYRKTLRRPVAAYTKTKPPQVKAAEKLGWVKQTGRVEYWMTRNGAEPCRLRQSPLDYEHYIEKQLKPIAYALEKVLHFKLDDAFGDNPQPWLFKDY